MFKMQFDVKINKGENMKLGLVGYCQDNFDENIAGALLALAFIIVEQQYKTEDIIFVSGLTNTGILKIGYKMAEENGWKTVGIACEKYKENPCFNVDEKIIVGEDWGDESETFLNYVDVIIRVGGGKQSMKEIEEAKKMGIKVYEYDLPEKD